jgi:curved DNA-binding protein
VPATDAAVDQAETAEAALAIEGGLEARGRDIWLTAPAPAWLIVHGGRALVETPLGPKSVWVTSRLDPPGVVRLKGEGLPALGDAPAGDLVIRLAPDPTLSSPSQARVRLTRFSAAWAA